MPIKNAEEYYEFHETKESLMIDYCDQATCTECGERCTPIEHDIRIDRDLHKTRSRSIWLSDCCNARVE